MRLSGAQEVADDHDACGYAHSHMQRRAGRRLQFGRGLDNGETRPHGVLGVVLMRLGIPKICEHSIAHILRDESATASDQPRTTLVVGRDDVAHVFGIETRRHRCRADQIAEHDGKLTALCGVLRCRRMTFRLGGGRLGRAEACDGFEQALSVPHGHAELLEVALGQIGQHGAVNFVFAENVFVLA